MKCLLRIKSSARQNNFFVRRMSLCSLPTLSFLFLFLFLFPFSGSSTTHARARAYTSIRLKFFSRGFHKPVHLIWSRGSAGSYYVSEQKGRIIQVSKKGIRSTFLDVRRIVNSGYEEGLLSLAFAPDFRESTDSITPRSRAYVYLTSGRPSYSYIFELPILRKRSGKIWANWQKRRLILRVRQPYSNHNGGHILFGPDGYLYIGLGDGGSGGDPRRNGQNKRSLLGKILRIDPRRKGNRAYRIPRDNPFKYKRAYRPEIFALGLRNPWRLSFDRKTRLLYVADVGQDRQEEINLVRSGSNLGWNIQEGRLCFRPRKACPRTGLTQPIHVYGRKLGQSITGGYVYRGRALPSFRGSYFFADFIAGSVWALKLGASGRAAGPVRRIFRKAGFIASFAEDLKGELYIVQHGKGRIYKLVPAHD